MKTLKDLEIPKDEAVKFPFGNIKNETETEPGTPVIREVYGDIITNLYKLLQVTKEDPTGDEDSDDTQYQLLNALRKFTNELNDVEKVLNLASTTWAVDIDLSLLPPKYVLFARAAENYDANENYSFKGSGVTTYNATSPTGFNVNDEVLIIIDPAGVRFYSITKLSESPDAKNTFTVLGTPVSYNDTNKMYYLESGKIYTDDPLIYNIESVIRNEAENLGLIVSDAIIYKTKIFALVYDAITTSYFIYTLPLSAPTTADLVTIVGKTRPTGTDYNMYMYADENYIYFTNGFNTVATDNTVDKFTFNEATNTITYSATVTMQGGFIKTTNAAVILNKLYQFINTTISTYDVDTGVESIVLSDYTLYKGVIFNYNTGLYFTKNEVATKWTL